MSCRNLFSSVLSPVKGFGGFSFTSFTSLMVLPAICLVCPGFVFQGFWCLVLFLGDAASRVAGVVREQSTLLLGFRQSSMIVNSL